MFCNLKPVCILDDHINWRHLLFFSDCTLPLYPSCPSCGSRVWFFSSVCASAIFLREKKNNGWAEIFKAWEKFMLKYGYWIGNFEISLLFSTWNLHPLFFPSCEKILAGKQGFAPFSTESYKIIFNRTRYTSVQRYGIKIMSRSGLVVVVHNMVFVFLQSNHFCITQQSADNLFTDTHIQEILLYCWLVITASLGILFGLFLSLFLFFDTWPENTKCSQNRLVSS